MNRDVSPQLQHAVGKRLVTGIEAAHAPEHGGAGGAGLAQPAE